MVSTFFVYSLFLVSLVDTKPAPTLIHLLTWLLAWILEVILLGCSLATYVGPHPQPRIGAPKTEHPESERMTDWEGIEIAVDVVRVMLLTSLIVAYGIFSFAQIRKMIRSRRDWERGGGDERAGLLNGDAEAGANGHAANGHAYGSIAQEQQAPREAPQKEAWSRPDKVPSKSWWEYVRGYSLFFPYLWPAKSRRLQVTVVFCFVLVMLARVVNLLVPFQVGVITDVLAGETGDGTVPWGSICLYIVYRLLQGNNGLLGAARGLLWVPISQYSYRELSTAAFEHVHGLSLDFHLGKKTGEVLSALSKGNSINTFLEQVTFQVVPMLIDLGIAIGYFLIRFDAYYALVIAIVTFVYLYLTIRLAQWRADIRREMVNFSRQEDAVKYVLPPCNFLPSATANTK